MKKSWRLLLLLVLIPFSISCNNILEVELDAQIFPATVHAEMDIPPASDLVVAITVSVDGSAPISTPLSPTTCVVLGSTQTIPCVKSAPFQIPDGNVHTANIALVNAFGSSTVVSIPFKPVPPGKATNSTIKGGAQ